MYLDRHRQQHLTQPVNLPRGEDPGRLVLLPREVDPGRLVHLPRAEGPGRRVRLPREVDPVTAAETVMVADMDTDSEVDMAAEEVVGMARELMMAIPTDVITSVAGDRHKQQTPPGIGTSFGVSQWRPVCNAAGTYGLQWPQKVAPLGRQTQLAAGACTGA